MQTLDDKLVIAVSSRSLFKLDRSNTIYEENGLAAYVKHQLEHEHDPPKQGVAFPLIKRFLSLRSPETGEHLCEVIVASRNNPTFALRLYNATEKYGLPITRGVFTSGAPPFKYLPAFNTALFLSANEDDVRGALQQGIPAATILTQTIYDDDDNDPQLRIAFDGDAVLFADDAERVYQDKGLAGFAEHEKTHAKEPLRAGPFKPFLAGLSRVQHLYKDQDCPLRISLVTARDAPAHERAIRTLRSWHIMVDEAFFMGGLDKTPILAAYRPHIYFDDQTALCVSASSIVPTGHVPNGVKNE